MARLALKLIVIHLILFVTFVDIDTPENNGGHSQGMVISPKELAVFNQI